MKQNFQLLNFFGKSENDIRAQVWCTHIAKLLMTVIRKLAQTNNAFSVVASLIRIHLLNSLDVIDLLLSAMREFQNNKRAPTSELRLKLVSKNRGWFKKNKNTRLKQFL